jgi:RimJ/RimL family protein N-acetyltransferase
MLFETKHFRIEAVENEDYNDIAHLYETNQTFVEAHMGETCIDIEWVKSEIKSMKDAGFDTCKIVDIDTKILVGYLDFNIHRTTYLSLIILDERIKGKGAGTEIYEGFEQYISDKSEEIRIDVVLGYNEAVENFWEKLGFEREEMIKLKWGNKTIPAIKMGKKLK